MRQNAQINRRQIFDIDCRIRQPLARQTVAEMNMVAGVQKIRVGQYRETGVAQNNGCRSDEKTEPVSKFGLVSAEAESSCVFNIR